MSIFAAAPGYLIPLVASFAAVYAFTRILTPEEYALYALATSLMFLFNSVFYYWIELGSKRFYEYAKRDGSLPTLAKSLYLGLFGSAVLQTVLACAILGLWPIRPELQSVLWVALGVALLRQWSALGKSFALVSMARLRFTAMESTESLVALGAGLVACRVFGMGATGILAGMAAAALVIVAYDFPTMIRRLTGGAVDFALQRQLVGFAAPLTLTFLVEAVTASADRFLIASYLDDRALGIYAVSYGLAERAVSAVFLATSLAAYPLLVRALEREGPEAARRQGQANASVLVALAIPACGGFIVACRPLAEVLIGPDYAASAADLMPLIAVGIFLHCLRVHYFAHSLHLGERTSRCMVACLPAAVINIALNIILLPRIGLVGAVWATVAAYAAALLISIRQAQTTFPLPFPVMETAKATAATALMCLTLSMIAFPPGVVGLCELVLTGVALYGALALVLNIAAARTKSRQLLLRASEVG